MGRSSIRLWRPDEERLRTVFCLSGGIQAVLAVLVFIWPRGLVNLWRRLQSGKYVRVDEARP